MSHMAESTKQYINRVFWDFYDDSYSRHYREIHLWSKVIKNINEYVTWHRLKVLYRYLYSNEEFNPRYRGRPRQLSLLYEWLLSLKIYSLARRLPPSAKVLSLETTHRTAYMADRVIFRTYHWMIKRYSSLNKWDYQEYVYIADKYGWDYELPDEEQSDEEGVIEF